MINPPSNQGDPIVEDCEDETLRPRLSKLAKLKAKHNVISSTPSPTTSALEKEIKIYLEMEDVQEGGIQSNSPVDFRTLPVDCRNFLAHTAVLLCCVCCCGEKNNASKF